MTDHSTDIVGIPSTVLAWLAMFDILQMNPLLNMFVSIFSLTWLSMQIFGWIEKRVKDKKKKNASK